MLSSLIREPVRCYNLFKGEHKGQTNIQASGMLERGETDKAGQYT